MLSVTGPFYYEGPIEMTMETVTQLNLLDLDFPYPGELVATEPQRPSRVMWVKAQNTPEEITPAELLSRIPPGDVVVINDTRVLPRRVFTANNLEILFIQELKPNQWEVLFPARRLKSQNTTLELPGGVTAQLQQTGLPQILQVSQKIGDDYFLAYGELALPPYIQKVRGERHQTKDDNQTYQTSWAHRPGSLAAPTASLHFTNDDLNTLKQKGVEVAKITLHIGLGTFLPIKTENLSEHVMHAETVEISQAAWSAITNAKQGGHHVWALGTTVTRALESAAQGLLQESPESGLKWFGQSQLFIKPGYKYQIVDKLMTNFHQPKSTLLALVAAFGSLNHVKLCYSWAIEKRFRLFSYGDLSVWTK